MRTTITYQSLIENYINGNLTDFKSQYKLLSKKLLFWLYVKNNYGEKVNQEAQAFLRKRGF